MSTHLSRIGFTWLDESVSAHPGLVFVQPIKPGRSCFGFIELSSVTYPGCLNPTFVQWAPGDKVLLVSVCWAGARVIELQAFGD